MSIKLKIQNWTIVIVDYTIVTTVENNVTNFKGFESKVSTALVGKIRESLTGS